MSTWDSIRRTEQRTGTFLGRTQDEQDSFYRFFADDRPRLLHRLTQGAPKRNNG